MCGIAGFIDPRREQDAPALRARAAAMAEALHHRGPDAGDTWADPDVGIALGFRRLAIIDLSPAGNQPMVSPSGRYVIVFNGEIYNFQDLRTELEAQNCRFSSDSDTEVILQGCERWGIEATVRRLIGMFAFGLWDAKERRLWLARDRLGIKPLYYGDFDGFFLFGSELKALRALEGWTAETDMQALGAYLRYNYVPAPHSIYRGIRKLEPGGLLSLRPQREAQVTRYWDMTTVARQERRRIGEREELAELDSLLRDAVGRRMVADVPLGALLSGGTDSSAVVALMQAQSSRPVKTFSIGFKEAEYDEAWDAKQVAAHLGTDHTELLLTGRDALDLIPNLPAWYDEPFADSSALPTYLVSQLARKEVTVALSGDGGDEVFLGYNRYHAAESAWAGVEHLSPRMRRFGAAALTKLSPGTWDRLGAVIPRSRRPRLLGDKLHKLAGVLGADGPDGVYEGLVSHWRDPAALLAHGAEPDYPVRAKAMTIPDFSERMAYLDTMTYLPDDILAKVDRASMAVSLEVRVPLLDHRVVEFAWSLPKPMRLRGSTGKWLLKQLLYRYVPQHLVDRPKMGFAVPLDQWLRGPLRDWAETLLAEKRLKEEGWFNPEPVREAWTALQSGRGNAQHALWGVLMAQAWRERYV